jgi:His/Glu/Gln/Arg/opine family amino acid ABC transporter permease subunit
MKTLKKIADIKNWTKKTKRTVFAVIIILIVCIILSAMKPSEAQMKSQASESMQKLIAQDETSSRKHITITYNSLWIINYCSFSSSGASAKTEKFVGFAGHVFKADEGAAKVTGQMINYTYRMLGCGENVMHGAKLTILLTTLTIIIGVFLGVFLALGKISKRKFLNKICSGYIFFFRGTPLLIQLFVIYFSIPGIFGFAWRDLFASGDTEAVYKGAFIAALIAFGLNSGAYCAEIVRAAIQSIDKGQFEAAKALGMSYGQTMRKVIIPQSVRRMIPPVCNEFIMVLKDASLVFAISLMDITTISKNIMTSEGSYLVFVPALVIYLIITAIFSFVFNKIEAKFSVYE